MAFPGKAPILVQIAPGADPADPDTWQWEDITSYVRYQDGITIEAGRRDEGAQVDSSKCTLSLDNRDGRFSPRNIEGAYFGKLSRNTPLRVRWLVDSDSFDVEANNWWETTDNGTAWQLNGAGGTLDLSDFDVTGGEAIHHLETANAYRVSYIPDDMNVRDVDVSFKWRLDLTDVTGGDVEPAGVMLRVQNIGNYYLLRAEINTNETIDVNIIKVQNASHTSLATTSTGLTYSASTTYYMRGEVVGNRLRIKVWDASEDEPAKWSLETTDYTYTQGGIGIRSGVASGNTNTKPIDFYYDDVKIYVDRFVGFVSEWPPRWDKSGKWAIAPITANGALRRLQQGSKPLRSPLYRTIKSLTTQPEAYWPMEDREGSTIAASGITNGDPLTRKGPSNPVFGSDRAPVGASSAVEFTDGGLLHQDVQMGDTTEWTVGFFVDLPDSGPYLVVSWETSESETWNTWKVTFSNASGALDLSIESGSGAATLVASVSDDFRGAGAKFIAVTATQNGGDIDVAVYVDGVQADTGTVSSETIKPVTRVAVGSISSSGFATDVEGGICHLFVRSSDDTSDFDDITRAGRAHEGETAADRIARLCDEEGVPYFQIGDEDDTSAMGPQPVATLLDICREAEQADGGILHELGGGLAYTTRTSRYNQDVSLTADVDSGEIAEPPEPTDDDQQLRNDVTANRSGGSSARIVDTDSVSKVGTYDEEITVNVETDDQLLDVASWRVHLGTVDEMRWPVITLDLARNTDLIEPWLAMPLGGRMKVAHTLAQLQGVNIDVLVEGWTEFITDHAYRVDVNAVPASPWKVGVLAVEEDFEDSTLSLTVTNGGDANWERTQTNAYTGSWSWSNGDIGNNETSEATISVPDDATTLSFWYATSSERKGANFEGDYLEVLVDDTQVLRAQGVTPWTQFTTDVTGAETVTFKYIKDNSVSEGDDRVWIDNLHFVLPTDARLDTDGSTLVSAIDDDDTSITVATNGDDSPNWTEDPGDFPMDIVVGGETMTVTDIEPYVFDTFNRDESNGWGTADSGQTWNTANGSASDYSVIAISEDFEDTTLNIEVTNAGNAAWARASDNSHGGSWSFASGSITNNQTSDAVVTVPTGAKTLTFWYATSSEAAGTGFDGDYLAVFVDDVEVLRAQGETDWTEFSTNVEGASTVTFRYSKDNSVSNGDDKAWIDDLEFDCGIGRVSHTTAGVRRFTTIGDVTDVEYVAQVTVSDEPSGADIIAALMARFVNVNNAYHAFLTFVPDGSVTIRLLKRVNNSFTLLDGPYILPGVTFSAGDWFWIRFRVVGNTMAARAWREDCEEPAIWQVTATDDDLTGSGAVGTHTALLAGNNNTLPVNIDFRNVRMITPQAFTVTRGTKATSHAAGASVNVANPIKLAW